ncbi:MAG: energy transducer TonB [Deltaproteobacteria bacterium]|nr:energy transducer TonB [Deltaproteobacteria bacterium]
MKRFFLAGALALALHGILFGVEPGWLTRDRMPSLRNAPITLALTALKPVPVSPSPPASEPAPAHVEKPEPPVPKKKVVEIKKEVKKEKARPKKTTKPVMNTERMREPEFPQVRSLPASEPVTQPASPREFKNGPGMASRPGPGPASAAPETAESGRVLPPPPPILKEAAPAYRKNNPPVYPRVARRRGYEGVVLLEALVGREGDVKDLRLLGSSGHEVLDRAAMDAVKKWVFEPGRRGEEPVEMRVKVPVRFQLR